MPRIFQRLPFFIKLCGAAGKAGLGNLCQFFGADGRAEPHKLENLENFKNQWKITNFEQIFKQCKELLEQIFSKIWNQLEILL